MQCRQRFRKGKKTSFRMLITFIFTRNILLASSSTSASDDVREIPFRQLRTEARERMIQVIIDYNYLCVTYSRQPFSLERAHNVLRRDGLQKSNTKTLFVRPHRKRFFRRHAATSSIIEHNSKVLMGPVSHVTFRRDRASAKRAAELLKNFI